MKTLEFEAEVREDETLKLPDEIARQFSADDKVRVLLLSPEENDWQRLSAEQFLKGTDDGDAIYDSL